MKTPARAEQERREAEISAVAEQLEQWFPGKAGKVAAALSEQIARRKPTRIEWAAQDIHVEVALDYNLGPEDPDAHLFGPGGWHIDCAVDLHVDAKITNLFKPLYYRNFSSCSLCAVRIPKAIALQRKAPLRVPSAPC